ncbi:aquaporin AQPcic-like isoform X1 [Harmonia axyridis]|uniref:aquaporin AQPcic-like isoform X1 n=1 Tax=Harmonia axyridis TaxID=115357 RepID=UPI001E279844|nr:aquaporin AQPcic-like isoform X1 [Harmonia axyridis]XP_045480592.1 aquaporin AQPcic-like isoform X1 [Harmonia axyridis]XP_045480593.1 aquaporin AQPcic-like isoform X1 [Harmonia axyridis]XP_045480594.1 aquaporin AQPcic-like isoform X1 [Harmonia axyridis]
MARNKDGGKPTVVGVVRPFLALFFAELIGTMILMFVGCASCISFNEDPAVPHHIKSLGFGFAVHVAIQVVGHITACHINPAVSITSLLLRKINIIQFVVYLLAQFLGAVLGFGLLKVLFPEDYVQNGFCMTKVGGGATLTQGFFIELVITCILCFVLCSVWDDRNAQWGDSTPLRFAIIVGVLSIIGGPLTGASMNTARSFAPAVFGNKSDWEDQWVYWTAPNISPFISVGFYKLFFSETKAKNRSEEYSNAINS